MQHFLLIGYSQPKRFINPHERPLSWLFKLGCLSLVRLSVVRSAFQIKIINPIKNDFPAGFGYIFLPVEKLLESTGPETKLLIVNIQLVLKVSAQSPRRPRPVLSASNLTGSLGA